MALPLLLLVPLSSPEPLAYVGAHEGPTLSVIRASGTGAAKKPAIAEKGSMHLIWYVAVYSFGVSYGGYNVMGSDTAGLQCHAAGFLGST